ncbi:MAG: ATP-dependent DNA helicase RecG [Pseudomonadota bacterium]
MLPLDSVPRPAPQSDLPYVAGVTGVAEGLRRDGAQGAPANDMPPLPAAAYSTEADAQDENPRNGVRPSALEALFAPVISIEGIGPKLAALIRTAVRVPAGLQSARLNDLLWHFPTGLIDRSAQPTIENAEPGTLVTLKVRVVKQSGPPNRKSRAPHRVTCEDDTGRIALIYFRADKRYLESLLPIGEERVVSGRVERYGSGLQMTHPDFVVTPAEFATMPLLQTVYPMTAGLTSRVLTKAMGEMLRRVPMLAEWQDPTWLAQQDWPDIATAISRVHRPQSPGDISSISPFWQRLAFDELLANQLALALVREGTKKIAGRPIRGTGRNRSKIFDALPFTLTNAQATALDEIADDMEAPHRMLRLLQGDVGSGKTVVALMAMAHAAEAGFQSALMAPTEVLARQHLETIAPLAQAAGLRIALLTGREKGRLRKQTLRLLADGEIDVLVGTHALFQPDVTFKALAFSVIDEQHRFGVHQRLALQNKGADGIGADILVMTATPIPRTLLMTQYGDLDVSKLTEKPAGRKPVDTRAVSSDRIEEIILGLERTIAEGAQAYWVCPLVESSDKLDLAAAEERYAHLKQYFGDRVSLVHGQMSGPAKDAAMEDFSTNRTSILVSTTVIEVGVNVPNATVMVIEHAERFGLAQLHQLRGRVGRGERQSTCILLYAPPLGETAKARIETMRETEDGFVIAEQDLKLRGGGELLGTRQSGLPEFRIANVPNFDELIAAARDDAELILRRDPELVTPRGRALRTLLYLFECDEAIRLFRAG